MIGKILSVAWAAILAASIFDTIKKRLFAIIAGLLLQVWSAQAASITYQLNSTLLPFVSGTITTDGTTGPITLATSITNWTINQNNDTIHFESSINPSDSTVSLSGNALTATTTELFFNFGGSGGSLLDFASNNFFGGSGGISLQYCDATGNCLDQNLGVLHSIELMVFIAPGCCSTDGPSALQTDTVEIATAIPTTATPLPATLPLMGAGLGTLGLLGWRRKRRKRKAGDSLITFRS